MHKDYVVSVVVICKNAAATIKKTLESIYNQTRRPDEVIVVDGNSSDGTPEIARHYPVKFVAEPGLGYGYARNLGVKEAEGDIVFFIDADCYADPRWIENVLPHFDDREVAGVTGRLLLWNTQHACARFLAYVGSRMNMPTERYFVKIAPTMNLALRRKVILEHGGFDSSLVRGEDTDFTYRITKRQKIVYDPEAIIYFKGSSNLRIASRKCLNHFIGVGQLIAKHGFKRIFLKLNLLLRGILLVALTTSLFVAEWVIAACLFLILLGEFIYKTIKTYRKHRDKCVIYYAVFFTLWSLLSFAIFYGIVKQKFSSLRQNDTKNKI